jgi:hypothetical protein
VNRGYNAFVPNVTSKNMINRYRSRVGNGITTH